MASIISKIQKAIKTVAKAVVATTVKYDPIKEASSFSFRTGTMGLAAEQDKLYNNYIRNKPVGQIQFPGETAVKSVENNLWIPLAEKLAPNNLVIRQLCLIDIFRNKPANASRILNLMNILSYWNGTERVWAEGYSYFQYTFQILGVWISKFVGSYGSVVVPVRNIVTYVNAGFVATSYKRGNIYYPAPFGDLTNTPLVQDLQINHPIVTKTIGPVKIEVVGGNPKYTITAKPLGLNLHCPVNNYSLSVVNGTPVGYKFYTSYTAKYPSQVTEISDMLNPNRIASMSKLIAGTRIV